eukprot:scaffold32663_cov30-Tisochrysis_lutea.AAC.1
MQPCPISPLLTCLAAHPLVHYRGAWVVDGARAGRGAGCSKLPSGALLSFLPCELGARSSARIQLVVLLSRFAWAYLSELRGACPAPALRCEAVAVAHGWPTSFVY